MNKRILIVGPSWLGDMVMAQTLFKLLKQQEPNTQLDVLAPDWSRLVVTRMPEITRSISLPIKHGEIGLRKRFTLAKELQKYGYDQAILLTNTWKSALIPWLARIPVRTGWLGELRWGVLNDVRHLNKRLLTKMVQRYAALGLQANASLPEQLPIPKLTAPPESVNIALNKFNLNTAAPILALCPGAAYGPAKRWPIEYFVQIAQQRLANGWQVWFFGSQQDELVVREIQQRLASATTSLAGKLNLLETIDLLSVVNAVVANDSGLLHTAAALDKPLVAIYGSTTPDFTPPLGTKVRVLKENLPCSPCFKRECKYAHLNCMYMIKPERVLDALDSLENA